MTFSFSHPNRESDYRDTTNGTCYSGPRRKCLKCKAYKYTSGGTIKGGFVCRDCQPVKKESK